MEKELYESPEMEIVAFEMADVITTSGYCDNYTRKQYEAGQTDCKIGYFWYLNPDGDCANFYAYVSNDTCIDQQEMMYT